MEIKTERLHLLINNLVEQLFKLDSLKMRWLANEEDMLKFYHAFETRLTFLVFHMLLNIKQLAFKEPWCLEITFPS